MKYWIIVASKDHLQRGIAGGFIQANHGKAASLKRMQAGDWVLFYSPRLEFDKPEKLQCFTARRSAELPMMESTSMTWGMDLSLFAGM